MGVEWKGNEMHVKRKRLDLQEYCSLRITWLLCLKSKKSHFSFGEWIFPWKVLSMLSTAKEIIDEGRMSEHEIENVMLEYITSGFKETENGSGRSDSQKKPTQDKIGMTEEEWKLRTRQKVRQSDGTIICFQPLRFLWISFSFCLFHVELIRYHFFH